MKPGAAVAALSVFLGACGSVGHGSYGLDPGDANYDALKAATDKCAAEDGHLKLKSGFDGRELSNYACKIGGTR